MPADQLLATLLRALQHSYAPEESSKLLTTAASLLLSLSNPLNVTLLTSQLLSAPAIWERHDGLKTCLQVLRCFHTASSALAQPGQLEGLVIGRRLSTEDWIKAIIRGADKKSPRWKHLLPFAGLLLGLQNGPTLGSTVRGDLLDALVKAINLALEEAQEDDELPQQCITLAVNYTFDLLPESRFKEINREALLPVLVRSAFFSVEGLRSGYFLGPIDADVVQAGRNQFTWARESTTYFRLEQMLSRPLVTSMGPLSRLIGFSLEHVKNPALVYKSVEDVVLFARTLATQWRQNKLSEIDASEERIFIESDALATTIPRLWDVLKTCMFSCISVLRVVIARAVVDSAMARDDYAPFIAMQTLHALRHLYFISSRLGPNSFSTHIFVFLTAIDILSAYPEHIQTFLTDIQPLHLGQLPPHPLDRTLDHFFLNIAEHFTLVLPSSVAEDLLVAAAIPYINSTTGNNIPRSQANLAVTGPHHNPPPNSNLRQIFEAAHSVILAVLSAPQNVELAAKIYPFYIDALFNNFPPSLSPRQFRLAFKTLASIACPPSALAAMQPDLAATILELLRHRALQSDARPPSVPIPAAPSSGRRYSPQEAALPIPQLPPPASPSLSIPVAVASPSPASRSAQIPAPIPPLPISSPPALKQPNPSEQSLLTLTIIDSLPYLPIDLLEEWLPITATLIRSVIESDHHPRSLPFPSTPTTSALAAGSLAGKQSSAASYPPTTDHQKEDTDENAHGDGETCLQRFWEVLSSGEMDVDRAQVCVAWWTTRGGRDLLLFGEEDLDMNLNENVEADEEEGEGKSTTTRPD